jgi:hypothetical protein
MPGKERQMVAGMSRHELVSRLVRIGEMMVTGEHQAEIDAYFAPDFTFHGPDGGKSSYEGLQDYAGTFVRDFAHSPVGPCRRTASG